MTNDEFNAETKWIVNAFTARPKILRDMEKKLKQYHEAVAGGQEVTNLYDLLLDLSASAYGYINERERKKSTINLVGDRKATVKKLKAQIDEEKKNVLNNHSS